MIIIDIIIYLCLSISISFYIDICIYIYIYISLWLVPLKFTETLPRRALHGPFPGWLWWWRNNFEIRWNDGSKSDETTGRQNAVVSHLPMSETKESSKVSKKSDDVQLCHNYVYVFAKMTAFVTTSFGPWSHIYIYMHTTMCIIYIYILHHRDMICIEFSYDSCMCPVKTVDFR